MWREQFHTNTNFGIMPPFQCEPGCTRMTGTTSWGRFLRRVNMNKKIVWKMLLLVALLMVACPLFGQTPNNQTANGHWVPISAGFSMAIASGMCGLAQAKAVAAAAEGMARNPGAAAAIRFALLLGLVLIESLALYTLVIIFVKVG
jgi:F-type H+-transporting ATPase subunit c